MREHLSLIFKKLPTGVLNALLMVTLVALAYFAREERAAALTQIADQKKWDEQQDEHLNKLDTQLATLTANVANLVELEKQSRERGELFRQERVRTAEQLGRAIALVEAHIEASHGVKKPSAVQ